ncbi:NAD(P)/FAD-dependent oxidoreductase [Chloroflexus aggregans]|uniref:Amine oxidase n=1 Tax=Chloroflexus aggregans (strain MD-66 / DSM 9485) TaxID=326427 RepID=B8G3E2_CHLAD|nr:NAD(P)/FAD-dependent oxidoreductase [Chloroflexus aggregans]ACL25315.1 amine oxidase [Chloroflexus aggregans DSM 9485]
MQITVVGGGVAGLVCARTLHRAGHQVTLIEASDGLGGRVRSDRVDGFVLDRGFQVLFTAYPAVQRQLKLAALDLRAFDPGAIVAWRGRRDILTDPLRDRDPSALIGAVLAPVVSIGDKLRTLQLAVQMRRQTIDELLTGPDRTTLAELQALGFSQQMIDRFFRPFFGGIFLDRSLQTSAKCFRFNFKMMSDGQTVVPNSGMGAIADQLAAELIAAGKVRLQTRAVALINRDGGVSGVRLADGSELQSDAVVLATPAPETARLSELPVPEGSLGSSCVWLATRQPLYRGTKLLLNAEENAFVNTLAPMSAVAPGYAPPGWHLYAAAILGVPELDDSTLIARVMVDLHRIFANEAAATTALANARILRVDRIPFAQFPQPPGLHPNLPDNRTTRRGLYLAGELTEASSINAAMLSGERCAEAILQDVAR